MPNCVLKKVTNFKYLGSTLSSDGKLDQEVEKRIQAGWRNWKRLSGVLCDKRISARQKGKVHKMAVRPAMIYGAETWSIKKTQEKKLNVAEMKMLRWACGHTRLDRIENQEIRKRMKVTELHKKVQEKRLRWYGHVIRHEDSHVVKRALNLEVEGRRRRGRPQRRWMDCVSEDLEMKGLTEKDAVDRKCWVLMTNNGDPT